MNRARRVVYWRPTQYGCGVLENCLAPCLNEPCRQPSVAIRSCEDSGGCTDPMRQRHCRTLLRCSSTPVSSLDSSVLHRWTLSDRSKKNGSYHWLKRCAPDDSEGWTSSWTAGIWL